MISKTSSEWFNKAAKLSVPLFALVIFLFYLVLIAMLCTLVISFIIVVKAIAIVVGPAIVAYTLLFMLFYGACYGLAKDLKRN